jgi:hypothetical protein
MLRNIIKRNMHWIYEVNYLGGFSGQLPDTDITITMLHRSTFSFYIQNKIYIKNHLN